MGRKLIGWYVNWLTLTSGEREIPNIIGVFVFAAFALVFALLTGLPAFHALRQGVPSQGSFQWQGKNGQMVSTPIQPLADIDAIVIVLSVAFLLSGFAFCFGWLERFSK